VFAALHAVGLKQSPGCAEAGRRVYAGDLAAGFATACKQRYHRSTKRTNKVKSTLVVNERMPRNR